MHLLKHGFNTSHELHFFSVNLISTSANWPRYRPGSSSLFSDIPSNSATWFYKVYNGPKHHDMIDTRYCHMLRLKLPFLKIHLLQDHPWSTGSPQKMNYMFWTFSLTGASFLKLAFCYLGFLVTFCLNGNGTPQRFPLFLVTAPKISVNLLSFFNSCSIFLSIFPFWVCLSLKSLKYICSNIYSILKSLSTFFNKKMMLS